MAWSKDDTPVVSVHRNRAMAREREQEIQGHLDAYWRAKAVNDSAGETLARRALVQEGVPMWAHGVKVERVGNIIKRWVQWGVLATLDRGH